MNKLYNGDCLIFPSLSSVYDKQGTCCVAKYIYNHVYTYKKMYKCNYM